MYNLLGRKFCLECLIFKNGLYLEVKEKERVFVQLTSNSSKLV